MASIPIKHEMESLVAEKGIARLPKVVLAASECAPLAKTGGLADVVGTLPKYLRRLGFDARVIIPFHRVIKENYAEEAEFLFRFEISLGWRRKYVGVYRLMLDKLCVWLIENDEYFSGPIYLPNREGEQYAFFTRAVLEALPRLDFIPDIIHCSDWHTGMLPLLLKTQYIDSPLSKTKSLITIHNIAYQGICGFGFVQDYLSVPDGCFGLMERFGQADFLKAGVVMADRVNTVSPSYAREICTPEFGEGLDGVMSMRGDVKGIINGIDRTVWNPKKDVFLPVRFSVSKLLGKLQCKTALLEELGLEIVPNRPLLCMVTRLASQKGIDLVMTAMDNLLRENDFAFVLLGSGDTGYENWFRELEKRHLGRVCSWIGYSDPLSHRIYAGSDFLLMPSRFEPCGISQLIAMAYGTLPIARETGGLRDTVLPYDPDTGHGTGFTFTNYEVGAMTAAIRRALSAYDDKPLMQKLIHNAMSVDFSCDRCAFEYARIYLDMI